MARRSVTGQLNMFDLFNNIEAPGEVQMVSLMPEEDMESEMVPELEVVPEPEIEAITEPEIVEEPVVITEPEIVPDKVVVPKKEVTKFKKASDAQVAMSRTYEIGGEKIEIAYINYNKVRITRGKKAPEIKEFESSKEAVDYYVEKMQELEPDE